MEKMSSDMEDLEYLLSQMENLSFSDKPGRVLYSEEDALPTT